MIRPRENLFNQLDGVSLHHNTVEQFAYRG